MMLMEIRTATKYKQILKHLRGGDLSYKHDLIWHKTRHVLSSNILSRKLLHPKLLAITDFLLKGMLTGMYGKKGNKSV